MSAQNRTPSARWCPLVAEGRGHGKSVDVSTKGAYVDDVTYVRHFVAEQSPTRLRLAAALNGITPPSGDSFDYLELGCAHVDTLTALAAAHPKARFVGIDLLPAHVASAKELAAEGGVKNVSFHERDFAAIGHEDFGEFDFIAVHGVLSWIGPDKRAALIELAARKLRPGGLLYVSYNTLPGWAAVEPLRQLVLAPAAGARSAADSVDAAARGVAFADALAQGGAEYFTRNPSARDVLDTMKRAEMRYVVHEYLHDHWVPMYFSRVAFEMAARELYFVGVQPLALNFPDTAIPPSLEEMFAAVTDRLRFESLKDFALNEFFRRDLYRRGVATRSAAATDAYLDETPLARMTSTLPKERTVKLRFKTLDFSGDVFGTVLDALGKGACTVKDLLARPEVRRLGVAAVRAAIVRLLVAEAIVPFTTRTRAVTPCDARYHVPLAFNRALLARIGGEVPIALASIVSGTAYPTPPLEAIAIRALTESTPETRRAWIADLVAKSVIPRPQESAIVDAVDSLVTGRLAKLLELGILAESMPQ
ncbi:methyltransferase regulatory domain-containing protein [soil metagenome]